MKKYFIIVLLFISYVSFSQKQKVQINGAARSNLIADELVISDDIDSITTRKSNYGRTLLDLGVSAYPNANTEVVGMFRISNALGGFWGGGTSFNVRQLTVKGVAGDFVKYWIGDIDLKMTPYTLFNTVEEGVINEADAFALRREIVHYDMFYNNDNTWRMQGGRAQFGLEFNKYMQSIDFDGFLTRQRATDGIAMPEQLYGGGSVNFKQSEAFNIKLNSINLFDLTETTIDSARYSNSVNTAQVNYLHKVNEDLKVGVESEFGMSLINYIQNADTNAPQKLDDSFMDVALTAELKKINTKVKLGLKDVGPDFFSLGAQTKRVGYGFVPFNFPTVTNYSLLRATTYFDVLSGNGNYAYKLNKYLTWYYPFYNNSNPYGAATPNRRGLYLNAAREDSIGVREAFVEVSAMQEIRGTGTFQKKKFMQAKAGADIYINDFIDWKKMIKTDIGVGYEITTRKGEDYEKVNLSNLLLDLGLTLEFIENFDLLVGAKLMSYKGNEFLQFYNQYNEIVNYLPFDIDRKENTIALGLRYRFNDDTALSAQYQMFKLDMVDSNDFDYGISQFNILYNMFF